MASLQTSRHHIRLGVQGLKDYLQHERSRLASSPLLLLTQKTNPAHPTDAWVSFLVAQQLGLRTVPATIANAYPTITQDIDPMTEMIQRTGAETIIAVGPSNTMDLAKALATTANGGRNSGIEQLILIPTTFPAMLTAAAERALLWDTHEETLVPSKASNHVPRTIALLEQDRVQTQHAKSAAYAAMAMLLSRHSPAPAAAAAAPRTSREKDTNDTAVRAQREQYRSLCLELPNDETTDHERRDELIPILAQILLHEGEALSFGLDNQSRRSIPLAVAASLLPLFPQQDMLTLAACLVPGLWDDADLVEQAPKLLTTEPVSELMHRVKTNQLVWNCADVPDSALQNALQPLLVLGNSSAK